MKRAPKLYIRPAADDDKRVPATGGELTAVEMLAYYQAALPAYEPRLKERLQKMVPNGWRDYRLMVKTADRLLSEVYATLPNKTMSRILAGAAQIELRICPKSVNPPKDYVMVEMQDFRHLIAGLQSGDCGICLGDSETAKKCPMRALLAEYLPPDDGMPFGSCPYAGNALTKAVGL